MHLLAQISQAASPEMISVVVAIVSMWGRMEYKLGKLEGKIEGRRK